MTVIRSLLGVASAVALALGLAAPGSAVAATPAPPPVVNPDTASAGSGTTAMIDVLANDSGDGLTVVEAYLGDATAGFARALHNKVEYVITPSFVGDVLIFYRVRDTHGTEVTSTLVVSVSAASATPSATPTPTPPATTEPTPQPSAPTAQPSATTAPRPVGKVTKLGVEKALARLGLPTGSANGNYDARTRRALCTWRTVTGRRVTRALPTKSEGRAIMALGSLPAARASMATGLNVSKTCQAAFWVSSSNRYRAIMPATTGKPGYGTRSGTHRVFVAWHVWRYSTIYPEARMYKPMQFSGGQAVHGSATDLLVKTYPASHGCVRMLHRDIDRLQAGGFGVGSVVRVFGKW